MLATAMSATPSLTMLSALPDPEIEAKNKLLKGMVQRKELESKLKERDAKLKEKDVVIKAKDKTISEVRKREGRGLCSIPPPSPYPHPTVFT